MFSTYSMKEDELVKFFVGVTDNNWYNYLAQRKPDEVNFWRPKDKNAFKAIDENGLFLFKLHSPLNFIAGGGFFVRYAYLPVSLAWEAFGDKNGAKDYYSFSDAIKKYRGNQEHDPSIGCVILTSPFFFDRSEWIPVPEDWSSGIMQGKTYSTDTLIGRRLYQQVQERIKKHTVKELIQEANINNRYGSEQIIQPRLGQGAFKVLVTEAYHRHCAISGEKTLPVLEAAHIKPYSMDGPHSTSNGLLLRKDIHALFDRGYITVNEDMIVEVSKRIKEDYGNGREYYAFHGRKLTEVPENSLEKPSRHFLRWHNENIYLP